MDTVMKTMIRTWYYTAAMVALCWVAFALSGVVSRNIFERLPHLEDEVAYLFQAKVFAAGELVAPIPEPRRAYWQPFVVDYSATGNRFGKYTPGWSAVLAIGVALEAAWWVNALLAAVTVALVYRVGREIFNADVGLMAALLVTFSPMALLLNGTLMGHTAALCYTVAFVYAYWRMERGKRAWQWGLLAGGMLGMLLITRPLTAAAVALPFVVWSGWKILAAVWEYFGATQVGATHVSPLRSIFVPLLLLASVTLFIGSAIPLFSAAATGDPRQNLYELVWSYDKIGFGTCCGRNGHTLEKGIRHTRFDLSLTAADLFGWQMGDITPEVIDHWQNQSDYFPNRGLSFVLLPLGVLVGLLWSGRRRHGVWGLLWGGVAWAILHFTTQLDAPTLQDPQFAWVWIGGALTLTLFPLLFLGRAAASVRYTWLLWSLVAVVVLLQMTYWIGSQRYSTRYYYEALAAAALLSALPLAWAARRFSRPLVYAALLIALGWGYVTYTVPRLQSLYRYNFIGREVIAGVEARREGERPVLVIVTGTDTGDTRVRWRALGALIAETSPFLDSEIVVAWDYLGAGVRAEIEARFPNRQIIEMQGLGDLATFVE
jgi:hypothetical protein